MLKNYIIPILVAGVLFTMTRPVLAQTIAGPVNLEQYVISGSVDVGSEIGENGFRQIYYIWDNQKTFITNTAYPNGQPDSENEYITWMGQSTDGSWQIYLYNLLSKSTIQLSTASNNANPQVSGDKFAWEGWVNNSWQIFLYDGITVSQITSDEAAINPDLDRNYLVYATLHSSGQWKSVAYSFSSGKSVDLLIGPETKHATLKNGQIHTPQGETLNVSTFFSLDLEPLADTATPSATPVPSEAEIKLPEEILEELILPATASAFPTPEPTGISATDSASIAP